MRFPDIFHLCLLVVLFCAPVSAQPPAGFSSVAVAPASETSTDHFGRQPRMVLDADGNPLVTFFWADPNGDGDLSDTALYFTAWDQAEGRFTPPVQIAVTGDVTATAGAEIPQSLAYDVSTNAMGIAYRTTGGAQDTLHVALSFDGGATWSDQIVASAPDFGILNPSLALGAGNVHLAYFEANAGLLYITGDETADASQWSSVPVPDVAGFTTVSQHMVSVAMDAAESPGLAYVIDADAGDNLGLFFWRPGGAPVLIAQTGLQAGDPDIKLTFWGTQPRIAFNGLLTSAATTGLYASHSTDTGATWSPIVAVPPDNSSSQDPPIWLASGSRGQGAIAYFAYGGNGDDACAEPKLSTSPDFETWTTCGPLPSGQLNYSAYAPTVQFGPDDLLITAFQTSAGQDLPYGVNLWLEPAATGPAPVIAAGGIGSSASFQTSVAPGSLATIFGSNMASDTAMADTIPIATTLADTTVLVDGLLAPLLYVSPGQINFQVPYETAPGTANVIVTSAAGGASASAPMSVVPAAPGIFQYAGNRAVVQNAVDFTLNSSTNGAAPGSFIVAYLTGSGAVTNEPRTGAAAQNSPLLSEVVGTAISASIGTSPATVAFAGLTPGLVGLLQMNIQVPAGLGAGDYPLAITIGDYTSNGPVITIAP